LRASVSALYPWKISFKHFFRKKAVRNTPICWRCFWIPKTEDSLPRCNPLKKLRFEEQINMDSSRLLRLEMMHGGKIFKNDDFKEGRGGKGVADSTYKE
jgi:hypothetical protein